MARATVTESEKVYLDSLRWRRGDLQGKIADVRERLESLTKEEDELRQELRAVEQLLFAADSTAERGESAGSGAEAQKSPAIARKAEPDGNSPALDLSGYGPTARKIYASAEQVIREAGVPLHYRVLADEVQRQAPLSGKDPGATLIAHLHRAQDLFPRVGRGVYGIQDMIEQSAVTTDDRTTSATASPRSRRTRRRRTR